MSKNLLNHLIKSNLELTLEEQEQRESIKRKVKHLESLSRLYNDAEEEQEKTRLFRLMARVEISLHEAGSCNAVFSIALLLLILLLAYALGLISYDSTTNTLSIFAIGG